MIPHLSKEIMSLIALYSGDITVGVTLEPYIFKGTLEALKLRKQKHLVYGNVQSGKTKEIVQKIREETVFKKVLVVQSLITCLSQYITRLIDEKIRFEVINKETYSLDPEADVYVVMGNRYRYDYFTALFEQDPFCFMLIVDEVDLVTRNCPFVKNPYAVKQIHVTATPYTLKPVYESVSNVPVSTNYYGLTNNKLMVSYEDDILTSVYNFLKEPTGMLLINRLSKVSEMKKMVKNLSGIHTNVPVILLSNLKKVYLNGKVFRIRISNVSKIIDRFIDHPHLIFVANRLASRTVSYVSSDFSRHLTTQITKIKSSVTNFVQGLRICGIYKDSPSLKIILPTGQEDKFEKTYQKVVGFSPLSKIEDNTISLNMNNMY
jgi:hypothetical protein